MADRPGVDGPGSLIEATTSRALLPFPTPPSVTLVLPPVIGSLNDNRPHTPPLPHGDTRSPLAPIPAIPPCGRTPQPHSAGLSLWTPQIPEGRLPPRHAAVPVPFPPLLIEHAPFLRSPNPAAPLNFGAEPVRTQASMPTSHQ